MKSHLSEDTDDENCEDPIRLFDKNINAVYFGSQPHTHSIRRDTESRWTLEQFTNNEFCQPIQNSINRGPNNELIQNSQTSECDISSLSVKLVDCGKFPWYFKKYTQQILHKINTDHNDSENEIDVGVADDSDDCIIVEVFKDFTNEIIRYDQNSKKNVKRPRNNDAELQRALSIKNVVKVDFKRNQGLVGMKITPKLQTNTTDVKIDRKQMVEKADAKQKSVMVDEKVVSATDRTLSHIIGTQLIPLKNERASNTTQIKINNEKELGEKPIIVKSSNCQNVTVQFEINKMSEKLIDSLKTKKTSDQSSEDKIVNKVQNTNILKNQNKLNIVGEKKLDSEITIKEKNISSKEISHVKDVKITCEKKNDQIKSSHNPWIGHLIKKTNKEEDIKEIKCTKQKRRYVTASKANKLYKKLRKKTEKQKTEPKSPILHCSTVPKKPKHEIPLKCYETNTDSNPPKEPIKIKKNCNLMNEANGPKHIISKTAPLTKPLDVTNKQALQKESSIIQEKTTIVSSNHPISSIVSDRLPKNYNEGNKTDFRTNNIQHAPIMHSSQNKTYEQNLLRETHQNDVSKPKINAFPIKKSTLKAPNKNNKPLSNTNVLTTTVITPTSGSKSVPSVNTNFPNNYGTHYPIHNALSIRMCDNNVSNNNTNPSNQNTNLPNNYGTHYPIHNALANIMCDNNVSNNNINPSDQNTNLPNYYGSHYPIHNALPNKMSDNNISNNNTNPSDQNTSFPNYYGSYYPMHPTLPPKMCENNISNNNINFPVQNPYASAILLKSNNRTNFPNERFREPPKQPMAPHSQRPINVLLSHSQPRCREPRPPFTLFYPPAPSQSFQSNFPSPANRFPNQFHPPHAHIAQQPSNPMQNLYRECWLSQNMAPPPPPPPSAPPTNNSPRNIHDEAKSKNCSYINRPSASVMPSPQKKQNSVNNVQTKNNSIIGMNTNGLVKKINIVAMPAKNNVDNKNGTIEVEQKTNPQTMSPPEDSIKVVATKTEMLKELDKLSFVDGNINNFKGIYPGKIIGEDKNENTLEVAIMSKPGRFETLKITMNNQDNPPIQPTKSAKGYSPPILPIPTYQKVLDKVMSNLQAAPNIALRAGDPRSIVKNETKPMRKRDFVKCGKRKLINITYQDNKRNEDAKKISLDEYKQRKLQNDSKPQQNKKVCKEKYNYNGKRPNVECKFRKNIDCNTETDLGYNSDSTVVL